MMGLAGHVELGKCNGCVMQMCTEGLGLVCLPVEENSIYPLVVRPSLITFLSVK